MMKYNLWFSVVPYEGVVNDLLALAEMTGTEFDPGAFCTNLFLRVPNVPEIAQICRDLLTERGATFFEGSR